MLPKARSSSTLRLRVSRAVSISEKASSLALHRSAVRSVLDLAYLRVAPPAAREILATDTVQHAQVGEVPQFLSQDWPIDESPKRR